ncbi:hypothetical protein [Halogranum rubrum]|uniref:DUF202 domain-containing protein n=1 Tax=Halogranum salarium B-1 TaxID=1210908 RepID=J3EUS3_9EURY|nr:hypothetical protein [Halogranum salarium]EJN58172.1 hypothetical protein HSB1_35890 [Halogranum salarium B-1]
MSSDDELSPDDVRSIVREETDAALRYQRTTLFGGLAVFCGGQLLLTAVVVGGYPLVALAAGGLFLLFGLVSLSGQRPFAERRASRTDVSSTE